MSDDPTCENCTDQPAPHTRTTVLSNPHSGDQHAIVVSLCPTCKDAFDMGAGNA